MDKKIMLEFIDSELEILHLQIIKFDSNKDSFTDIAFVQGQVKAYNKVKGLLKEI